MKRNLSLAEQIVWTSCRHRSVFCLHRLGGTEDTAHCAAGLCVHKVALLHVTGQVRLNVGLPSRRTDASHEPAHLMCNRATFMYTERFLTLLVGLETCDI